jgi:hypothetical protein
VGSDYEEAVPRLEWGIALAQEISTLHQEGKVRTDLGIVRSKLGQQEEAVEQFKQALILIRGVGDRPMEAETLLAWGMRWPRRGARTQRTTRGSGLR